MEITSLSPEITTAHPEITGECPKNAHLRLC